jgi:hypothetical protein
MRFYKDAAPMALKRVWLELEVFIAGIIFDRNSPVRFHQPVFGKNNHAWGCARSLE